MKNFKNENSWQLNELDQQLIRIALQEDLNHPFCDITTETLFPNNATQQQAKIISKHKEPIVICGLAIIPTILQILNANVDFQSEFNDGDILQSGATLMTLHGKALDLLRAERTLLNFLQCLCGVATLTKQFADLVKHTSLKIFDTRKTTPGFRHLEKYAVLCGGGVNHRMGLYDAILIKDTHVDLLGGMRVALEKLVQNKPVNIPIIVEVRDMNELQTVLQHGKNLVDRVLLDNMSPSMMKECVAMCRGIFATEASGNINLSTIQAVAETGVDFASVGALTHSAGCVDLSMKTIKI